MWLHPLFFIIGAMHLGHGREFSRIYLAFLAKLFGCFPRSEKPNFSSRRYHAATCSHVAGLCGGIPQAKQKRWLQLHCTVHSRFGSSAMPTSSSAKHKVTALSHPGRGHHATASTASTKASFRKCLYFWKRAGLSLRRVWTNLAGTISLQLSLLLPPPCTQPSEATARPDESIALVQCLVQHPRHARWLHPLRAIVSATAVSSQHMGHSIFPVDESR